MSGGQSKPGNPVLRDQVGVGCLGQLHQLEATLEEIKSCIEGDQLLVACEKKIPLLNSAFEPLSGVRSKMPIVRGRVGEKTVAIL